MESERILRIGYIKRKWLRKVDFETGQRRHAHSQGVRQPLLFVWGSSEITGNLGYQIRRCFMFPMNWLANCNALQLPLLSSSVAMSVLARPCICPRVCLSATRVSTAVRSTAVTIADHAPLCFAHLEHVVYRLVKP